MSVIVAVAKAKRAVIACDTVSFCGSHRENPDNIINSKIRTIGSSLVGAAGWVLYENLFEHYLHGKRPPALKDEHAIFDFFLKFWRALRDRYTLVGEQSGKDRDGPFGDLDAEFLIANRHGLFAVDSNMTVLRIKKYYAIGSGSAYAFGTLTSLYDARSDPADIAAGAVRAAIQFDEGCGGDVEVRGIKTRG